MTLKGPSGIRRPRKHHTLLHTKFHQIPFAQNPVAHMEEPQINSFVEPRVSMSNFTGHATKTAPPQAKPTSTLSKPVTGRLGHDVNPQLAVLIPKIALPPLYRVT